MSTEIPQPTERRRNVRFPIIREATFRLLNQEDGQNFQETGECRVIDISSSGVLFATDKPVAPEDRIQLSIAWPVLLHNRCPLNLVAEARVVRYKDGLAAVEILHREFRTRGSKRTRVSPAQIGRALPNLAGRPSAPAR